MMAFTQTLRQARRASWGVCVAAIVFVNVCPAKPLPVFSASAYAAPQTANGPARRIVSLVPSVTEMLFAIGAGVHVVGVSSFDRFPAEVRSRPAVGALLDPDLERIATLKPDLVIVYGSQAELSSRLSRLSVPTYAYRHSGLSDITETLRDIGKRVGYEAQASGLAAEIDADLHKVRSRVAGRPAPLTALVFGREPGSLRGVYASGGVGFLHDMLTLAGGRNVFATVTHENLQVSSEQMLATAPEVILEVRSSGGWTEARMQEERRAWNILPSLPAVRTGRVYILADDMLTIPGPRVATAAARFAETLHPGR